MNGGVGYVVENLPSIGMRTLEHLGVVGAALLVAAPTGLAIGIALSRPATARLRGLALVLLGLGQTIPSIAILALAIGLVGIGMLPAIGAIALYAVIPVARGTTIGLLGVDEAVIDAARGLGMSAAQIIRRIEFPLALPVVIGGLRLASVGAISAGALGYLVGAGGLGEFIFTGVSLLRPEAMLAGGIPAILIALAADYLFDRVERRATWRNHAQ